MPQVVERGMPETDADIVRVPIDRADLYGLRKESHRPDVA